MRGARLVGALLLSAAAVLGPVAGARADSLTWGYDFQRDRTTTAPLAVAAVPPAGATPAADAAVVPLPGASQSTPVVFQGTWYEWTYWARGNAGALWTGRIGPGGAAARAHPLRLPGQGSPDLAASAGEAFDQPSDAAVSPDGRWVAFGVGKYLYWWPSGRPSSGVRVSIAGPVPTGANSTSPTFVPDAGSPTGWAVCDGNWNGAFDCFAVDLGPFHPPLASYRVTMTTPADGDGYAPITSSATYDPATGDVFFGVASWHDPRVIRMNPLTGAYADLDGRDCACAAVVRAPVSAAVAESAGAVYATDDLGDVYRFDPSSGRLTAAHLAGSGAGLDIVSPAVAAGVVYVVENGYRQLLALSAATLARLGAWPVSAGAGEATAVTVVQARGAADEIFYGRERGGVGAAIPACRLSMGRAGGCASAGALVGLGGWSGAPTDAAGYDFTAPVVDGADVLLWSDAATRFWLAHGDAAMVAPPPPGAVLSGTPGGLQVYRLKPRLSAFLAEGAPGTGLTGEATVASTGLTLYVLQPVGALPAVRVAGPRGAGGAATPAAPDAAYGAAGRPCPADLAPNASFGVFPFHGGIWPASGCGPLSTDYAALSAYASAEGTLALPAYGGLAPRSWKDAGAGYEVWRAALPSPPVVGLYRVAVTSRLADGTVEGATVWYQARCPSGFAADATGRCTVCLGGAACCPPGGCRPIPCPNGQVRGADGRCHPRPVGAPAGVRASAGSCAPGAPVCAAQACPSGVVPGSYGMTSREYAVLCGTPPAWLVDPAVVACYGGWWSAAQGPAREGRCAPAAP